MTTVFNLHKWYRALNFILFLAFFHLLLCFLTWAMLLIHCLQILLVNLSGCICILEKYVMSLLGVHLIGTNGTVPWILYSLRFLLKHSPPGGGGLLSPPLHQASCLCMPRGRDLPLSRWPAPTWWPLFEADIYHNTCLCQALRPLFPCVILRTTLR